MAAVIPVASATKAKTNYTENPDLRAIYAEPGPIKDFPAPGLHHARRFITSNNEQGQGVFVVDDHGDHHRDMVNGRGLANIIYSSKENPVDLDGNADIACARDNEPGLHVHNGSVVRLIDFAPGVESPMRRAMSIDYGIVIEGEFQITLDSGETRIMRPGDVSVQRATMHQWRNTSPDKCARMVFVLLDCNPFSIGNQEVSEELGDLTGEYAGR